VSTGPVWQGERLLRGLASFFSSSTKTETSMVCLRRYMYDYIFITVPRKRWNTAECVLWYCMEAFASAIVQVRPFQSAPAPHKM
jgi:hypothetical protein